MITRQLYTERSFGLVLRGKLRDYGQLVKFRLNLTVVLSTFIGYILGSQGAIDWHGLFFVVLGGFLTVGAANGINQIIERESDRLMRRTENRPLATSRMTTTEATIACLIMGVVGVLMISLNLNALSGWLSLISLCLYGFVYTPLKKISPIAVYVGAIPGALPPIIGYVAATGSFGAMAWILFIIQFIWQFPHFYSIAWILDDDYKRAGLKLLPIGAQKDRSGAIQIFLFAAMLIPASLMPWLLGSTHFMTSLFLAISSGGFAWQSLVLYRTLENKAAKRLMFYSILYLPLIFLILLLDKAV